MSQIQIRIDDKTKKDAQHILEEVGQDLTSAIKIYLKQIILFKGIPLKIITENGLTLDEEKEILKASREAKKGKNITKAMNGKEALAYLKNLNANKVS